MTKPPRARSSDAPTPPRHGLARVLSKLGICSRSQAWDWIKAGRVRVNGVVERNPERPTDSKRDRIEVDGERAAPARRVYLMLNKPRGLVTTASDEKGRPTVFQCLEGLGLPPLGPVGRLDQASEGLLLFSNDTLWADAITRPDRHLDKVYHVQIDQVGDEALLARMRSGVASEEGVLRVKGVSILRVGERNSWLEVVLDEGRNRQIRRLLEGLGVGVMRLIRIAIGSLELGSLPKGKTRALTAAEVRQLGG